MNIPASRKLTNPQNPRNLTNTKAELMELPPEITFSVKMNIFTKIQLCAQNVSLAETRFRNAESQFPGARAAEMSISAMFFNGKR